MSFQILLFSTLASVFIVQFYEWKVSFLSKFLHHPGLLLQPAQKGLHDLKVVGAANRIRIHIATPKSRLLIAGHVRGFDIIGVVAKNQNLTPKRIF